MMNQRQIDTVMTKRDSDDYYSERAPLKLLSIIKTVRFYGFVCLIGLLMPMNSLWALGLTTSPSRLVVQAPQTTGIFTLSNSNNTVMNVQLRVYEWQQINGENVYHPSPDIMMNPPMLRIAPNGQQLVRIIRRSKKPLVQEKFYRMFADELPPNISVRKPNEVVFIARYDLPVVFAPQFKTSSNVAWSVIGSGANMTLKAVNSGNGHLKIADLEVFSGNSRIASKKGIVGYVLPGATMTFKLSAKAGKPTRMTFKDYDKTVNIGL